MKRLAVALVMVVGMSTAAYAGVEIGGTAGLHIFSDSNSLGAPDSKLPAQANSAMFGLRLGIYFNPAMGVELEAGYIPTETATTGTTSVFDVNDATVRAQFVYQVRANDASNNILPFVLVGGGETRVVNIGTADKSLFRDGDMRSNLALGVGAKYRAGGGWGVRVDLRALFVHSNEGKAFTNDFEAFASLYREWGRKKTEKVAPLTKSSDSDADGIEDKDDKCPKEAEDKDGFQDDDGCPDPDNDNDGVKDDADKCKDQPEDKDGFQDDDGCPDPDNDSDGVPDASDKCADKAETKNGFQDDDGCPDEIPAALTKIIGPIVGVSFKANSADLAPTSNKALDAIAAVAELKDVKVEIGAYTDDQPLKAGGKFADNDALTQAQAEAVKAYLVKKGVAEDHIVAKGYGSAKPVQDPAGLTGAKLAAARKANRRVELQLVMPEAAAAEAPAGEAPKADEAPKTDDKGSLK